MKKMLVSAIAVAAVVLGGAILMTPTAANASTDCACVSVNNTDGTCTTTCCNAPPMTPPDPNNPPSGACGQVCLLDQIIEDTPLDEQASQLDELILVAGAANQNTQGGCVGLLGGTLHSGQLGPIPPATPAPDPNASYAACKADAVAACAANGCATATTTPGACP